MTRWRTVAVSVVAAGVAFGVAALVLGWLRSSDTHVARPQGNEVSVFTAAHSTPKTKLEVRGYVFIDANAGTLLCSQTKMVEDRPACDGDVVNLEGLDTNRLPLVRAEVAKGGFDAWSDGQVVLLATSEGSGFIAVQDVLQG